MNMPFTNPCQQHFQRQHLLHKFGAASLRDDRFCQLFFEDVEGQVKLCPSAQSLPSLRVERRPCAVNARGIRPSWVLPKLLQTWGEKNEKSCCIATANRSNFALAALPKDQRMV